MIATPAVDFRIMPFGIADLDSRLGGGLRAGALHEATARSCSLTDDAAATLFLAGVAAREAEAGGGPVLWTSCRTDLYAPGLEQAGLACSDVIYAHPLSFVRDELVRRGVTRCADLATIRDGRHVQVAGIILVRQKPGSAKGVLFITIEDETGIANGILWPDRFEKQRRTVMSASMIGMRGRVQKEGEVIHVICDRIIDHGDLLTQVGQMSFPHRTGPGDGAKHAGSPDRGDAGWSPKSNDGYWPPHAEGMDPEDVVRFKSHDFH